MKDQLKRIIKQKLQLATGEAAFLGALGFSLPTIRDDSIPTMGVSSRGMYYNEEFVASMSDNYLKGIVSHELLHVALKHTLKERLQNRDHEIANRAMDYVINSIIKKHTFYGDLPDWVLLSDKYDESWSFERVYDDLIKSGMKPRSGQRVLDDHGRFTEDGELSSEEMDSRLRQAAAIAGKDKTPAIFAEYLTASGKSKYDWKKVLRSAIPTPTIADRSFSVPNRRDSKGAIPRPGVVKDQEFRVDVAVDTSGSVSNKMLGVFLRELVAITKAVPSIKLRIWCFDTSIYNMKEYNSYSLSKLPTYEFVGRGGTMFEVNWDFMKSEGIKPDVFLLFTDGYPCGTWGTPDYCKTVFVINSSPVDGPKPTFGLPVYIE